MDKKRRILSLVTALVLALSLTVSAGAAAEPERETLPPVMDEVHYTIGGAESSATELPYRAADWPAAEPELAVKHIWSGSEFLLTVATDFDYHHRVTYVADHWIGHQPSLDDPGVANVTDWYQYDRKLQANRKLYVYFLYYDQPGVYTSACYAAVLQPVAAAVSGIELTSPDLQPEDGFLLGETVSLRPVWTVGTADSGSFTALPGLNGIPAGAAVLWCTEDQQDGAVVEAADNTTPGADAAVLVSPEQGGLITYTASTAGRGPGLYTHSEPAALAVLWSSERVPEPDVPDTPDDPVPDEPDPEGYLPPVTADVSYTVGGPDSTAAEMPLTSEDWPAEAPDLPAQYAWDASPVFVRVTTDFDYHHRVLLIADHWLDHVPDPFNEDEVTDITEWESHGWGVSLDGTQYLYFIYYDQPGVYPAACYAAVLQPVAATISAVEFAPGTTEPEGGFQDADPPALRPVWTVGIISGGSFTALPQLHGCPQNAGCRWAVKDSDRTPVVDASGSITPGSADALLLPPAVGGSLTYTATVTNIDPHGIYERALYVPEEPAEIEVTWAAAPAWPIQSTPGASFTIEIQPNPDGSGSLLLGIPMDGPSTDVTTVSEFLGQITVPEGMHVTVCSADGTELAAAARIGTGCRVDLADASGTVIGTAVVVIRGDVLGTGVLDVAQLVRLAAACNDTRPLTGPYLTAAELLSGNALSACSLVALARMLQSI